MKISSLLSIKCNDSVLKWIVLYFTLVTTKVAALCNPHGYRSNSLYVKHGVNYTMQINPRINPCGWIGDCKIECYSDGSKYDASVNVQLLYGERQNCHSSGVELILHNVGTKNLEPNWFTANIKLVALELDVSNIRQFPENPFVAAVFSNVEVLTLKYLSPCELKKFTFTGLLSIKTLIFRNIRFDDNNNIEIGVLEFVKDTLEKFELIEVDKQNKEISINNFLGDYVAILTNMEYVKVRYNLSSINHLSFTAIPNARELDLSDCQITNIGEFAFNSLGENLQLLNLERNMLTTLPVCIFNNLNLSPMSVEPFLKIRLNGNSWDCEWGIKHFGKLLVQYSNFEGTVMCNTSPLIPDYPKGVLEFCSDPNSSPPTTTTPPTTTSTTTTTNPTTTIPTTVTPPTIAFTTTEHNIDENTSTENSATKFVTQFQEKQCFASDGYEAKEVVFIKYEIHKIHLTVNSDEVSVLLESNEPNLALIWFGADKIDYIQNDIPVSYHQSSNISCVIPSQKEIKITNFCWGTTYTICLIDRFKTTVSPIDCISYYHNAADISRVWLLSKTLIVSLTVGGLLATVLVGLMTSSIFLRYNHGKRNSFSFRISMHCSDIQSNQGTNNANLVNHLNDPENVATEFPVRESQTHMTGSGFNSKFESDVRSIDDPPPPLPPHPKWMKRMRIYIMKLLNTSMLTLSYNFNENSNYIS